METNKKNKAIHYNRVAFPDIVQPYYPPQASGKLKRSFSFEFSSRDWTGRGLLMGTGIRMTLWKAVSKCSADVGTLNRQIAESKLDLKREKELMADLKRRYHIDMSMIKLELDKQRAEEIDDLESRLAFAEMRERRRMNHLKEYLSELEETKKTLKRLEAEIEKDQEQEKEDVIETERVNGQTDNTKLDQTTGEEDGSGDIYVTASECDQSDKNEKELNLNQCENKDETGRGEAEETKFEIISLADAIGVTESEAGEDESEEQSETEETVVWFGFLRMFFCCCRRKRTKRR